VDKLIIGVAGMPGSGKSVLAEVARSMGIPVVVMGDIIREEAKRRGLEPTRENLSRIMFEIREINGKAAVAKRCIPLIKAFEGTVLVEGIRSLHEIEEFKKHFPNFKLIAVHASPKTRFERLMGRERRDDPKSWEEFKRRDLSELKVGLGNVIALADIMIINEKTLKEFKNESEKTLKEVIESGRNRSVS